MLADAPRPTIERLDRIYSCTTCKATFLLKSDVEEHIQHMPKHQDFASMPFK